MATILIIDSYSCVRELLHEELSAEGYMVAGTADISAVRELVVSTEPDLVILDLYLEKQTRWDLLCDIKDHNPHLPVLVFSAFGGYAKDPRLSQADAFIIKSIFFDELKRKIAELLKYRVASISKARANPGLAPLPKPIHIR